MEKILKEIYELMRTGLSKREASAIALAKRRAVTEIETEPTETVVDPANLELSEEQMQAIQDTKKKRHFQ